MTRFQLFAVAAAMSATAAAQTQATHTAPADIQQDRLIENTNVVYYGNAERTDSTAYVELLNQFYEDQFRHAQDPRAPYFMLLSRDGSLGMGIGGELEAIGSYDWDGSQSGTAFVPSLIPVQVDPASRNLLQMTPNRTSLYLSVFGNNRHFGKFQVYIHARFNGPGNTLKIDRAYATVGDWTVGYAKSTFDDPTAQPSTIDTEGPNSEIDDTRLLLRYMHNVSNHFSMALSVENPGQKVPSADGLYQPISDYMPDVAAFMQWQQGRQHVRLSALLNTLGYRNLAQGRNCHVAGWGLNLSTKLRPIDALTVYAACNTGQGIGDMVNDLSYSSNDLLGYADGSGRMYTPWSYGWYVALQYNYRPDLFSTLVFSQERLLPRSGSDYAPDAYRYGLYATANVFWNITPRMQVGAEFNIGRRCAADGSARNGYRAAMLASFSF